MPDLRYIEPTLQAAQPGRFETPYYAAYTNSGDLGGATYANDAQTVRLVDPKTGAVLYEGKGPEGAKMATGYANALSQDEGRKARWAIQVGTDGNYTTTGADSKDSRSLLSSIGHVAGKVAPVLALGALGAVAPAAGLAALGGLTGLSLAGKLDPKQSQGGSQFAIDPTLGTRESLDPIFSAKLPEPTIAPRVKDPYFDVDPSQYGMHGEHRFFVNPPPPPQPMAGGGRMRGPGGPREDRIYAKLSNGEYVVDAATVSKLGGGDNDRGADMLDRFRVHIHSGGR